MPFSVPLDEIGSWYAVGVEKDHHVTGGPRRTEVAGRTRAVPDELLPLVNPLERERCLLDHILEVGLRAIVDNRDLQQLLWIFQGRDPRQRSAKDIWPFKRRDNDRNRRQRDRVDRPNRSIIVLRPGVIPRMAHASGCPAGRWRYRPALKSIRVIDPILSTVASG